MYRTNKFKLIVNEDDEILYYENRVVMKGCENIVKLMLEMGLCDEDDPPPVLEKFNLTSEELIDLEEMLVRAILQGNKCIGTPSAYE